MIMTQQDTSWCYVSHRTTMHVWMQDPHKLWSRQVCDLQLHVGHSQTVGAGLELAYTLPFLLTSIFSPSM